MHSPPELFVVELQVNCHICLFVALSLKHYLGQDILEETYSETGCQVFELNLVITKKKLNFEQSILTYSLESESPVATLRCI